MAKPDKSPNARSNGMSDVRAHDVVEGGMSGRQSVESGETCRRGDGGRSQSLHSTEAAGAARSVDSKATPREGRQEGGDVKAGMKQAAAPEVSARTRQGAETHVRNWACGSFGLDGTYVVGAG